MIEQLKTIRAALEGANHRAINGLSGHAAPMQQALTALAQLEAMVGEQEPKFWYRPVGNDGLYEGPVHNNSIGGKMLRDEKPGEWVPLFEGAAPVAQQYEAGDMASAAAQGFRDGAASVAQQQEPVAWAMPKGDGTFIDVITPAEHAREEGSYTVPLFAHPAAQQPRTALEQYDLDQSPEYRKGWDAGRIKGYEVGYRYATEHAAPVAQQYEAGDMASAAAQGFRDGLASVQQGQEPVAWLVCSVNSDGSLSLEHAAAWKEAAHEHINDAITEHGIEEAASWVVRPAYVATPVAQQPQKLEDIEQYRMRMAGICTAAIGYWKEGDPIHPDYDTPALRDVAKLYAKYDALYKAQQPQAEPDDEILKERDDAEEFIDMLLDEVLGTDRPEWTSAYGRDDALRDVQERMTALHKPMVDKAWERFEKAQQPQARPDFTDEWTGYLKDGETPFERFLRERKDLDALTKLYQRALEENERLKAQQPQAEAYNKTELNAFIQELYDRKMREGEHGHYETLFHCVHQAIKRVGTQSSPAWEHHARKLTQWLHCMSYNDSYFGEPAGLVKQVAGELNRLIGAAPQQAEAVPLTHVLVPVDVLKAASESLGSFVSDHGWTSLDMQAMDNLDAILAQQKGGV